MKIPKITKKEMREIEKKVAKDFPDDFALQQVHISREIIMLEAKKLGISLFDYILMKSEQRRYNGAKSEEKTKKRS